MSENDAFTPEPDAEPLPALPMYEDDLRRTFVVCVRTSVNFDVYVGREMPTIPFAPPMGLAPGYFGNPHKARRKGEAVVKFRAYFMSRLHTDPEYRANVLALRGKVLGCWCEHPTPETCHAAVMAEWLNDERNT